MRPALVHQLADLLRIVGMRDRLRCPRCEAVGTYKPHGGWLDREDHANQPRRWMCKWCGYVRFLDTGDEGVAVPHPGKGYWVVQREYPAGRTPRDVLTYDRQTERVWPWRG